MYCKRCGTGLTERTLRCPTCDVRLRRPKRSPVSRAFGLVGAALALYVLARFLASPNPNDGSAALAALYAARSDPSVTTTAELQRAYDTDPRAADARFKSRTLVISGTLASRPQAELAGLTLRLASGPRSSVVAETLDAERPRVQALQPGDAVLLHCIGRGLFAREVLLNQCRLQP